MRCQASGHTDTRACESRVVFYYGRIRNTSDRSAAFGTAALTRSQLYNTRNPKLSNLKFDGRLECNPQGIAEVI